MINGRSRNGAGLIARPAPPAPPRPFFTKSVQDGALIVAIPPLGGPPVVAVFDPCALEALGYLADFRHLPSGSDPRRPAGILGGSP